MNPRLQQLLDKCDRNEGATPEAISGLLRSHPVLSQDYLDAMRQSDGIEGWVGENSYLMIYSLEQLPSVNKAACTDEFAPGMFIFGSDGGGQFSGVHNGFNVRFRRSAPFAETTHCYNHKEALALKDVSRRLCFNKRCEQLSFTPSTRVHTQACDPTTKYCNCV